eukprot:8685144-Pyramimonas_sp.AAC.1
MSYNSAGPQRIHPPDTVCSHGADLWPVRRQKHELEEDEDVIMAASCHVAFCDTGVTSQKSRTKCAQ